MSGHKITPSEEEESRAILLASKLGWPVDVMTLNGHDVGNLISELKNFGYLKDDEGDNK
jgi:hypothetical protein